MQGCIGGHTVGKQLTHVAVCNLTIDDNAWHQADVDAALCSAAPWAI